MDQKTYHKTYMQKTINSEKAVKVSVATDFPGSAKKGTLHSSF